MPTNDKPSVSASGLVDRDVAQLVEDGSAQLAYRRAVAQRYRMRLASSTLTRI